MKGWFLLSYVNEYFKDDRNGKWDQGEEFIDGDLIFYYNAKKQKLKIYRYPVKFYKRKFGLSNWNTSFKNKMKLIKRTINYSFQLNKNCK